MKRMKKHKVKRERAETSSAYDRVLQEHDLAYYIHDRVELMHQVFSVLKAKDLRSMAPECVRRLSIADLQELCTEELLGISSKRLCAVLDGAEPPSDTESSSRSHSRSPAAPLETISLDSISSDDEVLSHTSRKKKKQKRDSKSKKSKKPKASADVAEADGEQSRASRAGLTVLELLELQARARAIRAQLQQEQAKKALETPSEPSNSKVDELDDDEIEIKEEAPEVVEISSDDEKPDKGVLDKAITSTNKQPETTVNGKDGADDKDAPQTNKDNAKKKDKSKKKKKDKEKERTSTSEVTEKTTESNKNVEVASNSETVKQNETQTVTKRVNDLIITVPQQSTRKIKLNRSKVTVSVPHANEEVTSDRSVTIEPTRINSVVTKPPERLSSVISKPAKVVETTPTPNVQSVVIKEGNKEQKKKDKVKKKKRKERKSVDKEEDHDEIMLQLSDSEKMDLLEDFDRKHYDDVSSSEDSDSSSSDENESSADSVDNTVEKDKDSPVFGNKADMLKDGTITVEVINDNFYRGIEDLDKETEQNNETQENKAEQNNETQGNEGEIEIGQQIDEIRSEHSKTNQENEEKDRKNIDKDESQDNNSSDSETDTSQDSEHLDENLEMKDACPRITMSELQMDENINEDQESIPQNTITENSQQKINEIEVDTEKSDTETIIKFGYISITKGDVANNIEICNINEIPVLIDKGEESDEKLNEKRVNTEENTVKERATDGQMEVTNTKNSELEDNSETTKIQTTDVVIATDIHKEVEKGESEQTESNDKGRDRMERVINQERDLEKDIDKDRELSEGEVSSNESSEVEAMELRPEVVCISDEEEETHVKKKKKKEKKPKKEKKSKRKKSDFREGGDQNFYTENSSDKSTKVANKVEDSKGVISNKESDTISLDSDDDIYEILELSDDSSCYEVEGTVLSKEPTAEEIAALSAKIDEIERDEVVTEEQIEEHERMLKMAEEKSKNIVPTEDNVENVVVEEKKDNENVDKEKEFEMNLENISWKDRYLDSTKVKKVLKSSNILNAIRKKNKELKKKIEESKKKEAEELQLKLQEEKKKKEELENKQLEEGSIEHYNTLQGSTKYVDPLPERDTNTETAQNKEEDTQKDTEVTLHEARVTTVEIEVTGEMKKDAKQLLKMYKKLLKYNDISRIKQKDPNKIKKKKKKSKKKDGANV